MSLEGVPISDDILSAASNGDVTLEKSKGSPNASLAREKLRTVVRGVITPVVNLSKKIEEERSRDKSYLAYIKSLVGFIGDKKEWLEELLSSIRPGVEIFVLYDTVVSHSAVVACLLLVWFGARLGWGLLYFVVISLLCVNALERISIRKRRSYEAHVRECIQSDKLGVDSETLDWFNLLLKRMWNGLETGISEAAKVSINDTLQYYRPPVLYDLFLSVFTLGSVPPRIVNIRASTTSETSADLICDVEFVPPFDSPIASSAVAASESKKYRSFDKPTGSKIVLVAKIGRGHIPISFPVSVTNIDLRGTLKIHLEFIIPFPHVKKLDLSFDGVPSIDFDLRPLKALDVMDFGVLSKLIRDTTKSALSCCIVEPNRIELDMESLLVGSAAIDVNFPIGILEVFIVEGRGIKNVEFAGKTDPYVVIKIGGRELAKTKFIQNTLDPFWDEKFYIPITLGMLNDISNESGELQLLVYDSNSINKDTLVGSSQTLNLFQWANLGGAIDPYFHEAGRVLPEITSGESIKLVRSWGPPFSPYTGPVEVCKQIFSYSKLDTATCVGEVFASFSFIPISRTEVSPAPPLKLPPSPVSLDNPVILRVDLLDSSAFTVSNRASTICSIFLDRTKIDQHTSLRKGNNPQWNSSHSTYVRSPGSSELHFSFSSSGKNLGSVTVPVRDILQNPTKKEYSFNIKSANNSPAKVRFNFYLYTVDLNYIPEKDYDIIPLGLLKVDVVRANNLQNLELVGKSDPYAKVYLEDRFSGATHVKMNTVDPKWDETFHAICYDYSEVLKITLWDSNNIKKDRSLGCVSYAIGDIVNFNDANITDNVQSETVQNSSDTSLPGLKMLSGVSRSIYSAINDGLKIKILDDRQFDIWSPVYLSRSTQGACIPDPAGSQDTQSEYDPSIREHYPSIHGSIIDGGDSERQSGKQPGSGNFSGIDFISKKLRQADGSRPKYRGHLHITLTLYKVEKDMIIQPKPESFYNSGYLQNANEVYVSPEEDTHQVQVKNSSPISNPLLGNPLHENPATQTDIHTVNSEIVGADAAHSLKEDVTPTSDANLAVNNDTLSLIEPAQECLDRLTRIDYILATYHSAIMTFWVHYLKLSERSTDAPAPATYAEVVVGDHAIWRSRIMNCGRMGYLWLQSFEKYIARASLQDIKINIRSSSGKNPSNDDPIVGSCLFVLSSDTVGHAKKLFDVINGTKIIGQLCMSMSYIPIEAAASFDSSEGPGVLYCDIVSANDIEAVDSDGYSDPYVHVFMNGKTVVKTKAVHNCLSPVWNKSFSVEVSNRLRTTLEFQVKDQNTFAKNKILGIVRLNLATNAITGTVVVKEFLLEEARNGSILLRILFLPKEIKDFGIKTVKVSGRADELNTVDRDGPSGIKKIGNVIGNTIFSGPSRVGKLFDQVASIHKVFGSNKDNSNGTFTLLTLASEFGIPVTGLDISNQAPSNHKKRSTSMSMSSLISSVKPMYSGKMNVRIIAAEGVKYSDSNQKLNVYIKLKQIIHGKEVVVHKTQVCKKRDSTTYTWANECTTITVPPEKIHIIMYHKTNVGKDVVLGESTIDMFELISSLPPNKHVFEDWVNLMAGSGVGKVLLSVSMEKR